MGPKAETKAAKPKAAAAKPAAKKQTQERMVKKSVGGDKNGGHRLVRKTRLVRYFFQLKNDTWNSSSQDLDLWYLFNVWQNGINNDRIWTPALWIASLVLYQLS